MYSFIKIRLFEPYCSMRKDRRRDLTKPIVAFRCFTNSPKNEWCHSHCPYQLFYHHRGGRKTTQQLFTSKDVQRPNSKLHVVLYPEKNADCVNVTSQGP